MRVIASAQGHRVGVALLQTQRAHMHRVLTWAYRAAERGAKECHPPARHHALQPNQRRRLTTRERPSSRGVEPGCDRGIVFDAFSFIEAGVANAVPIYGTNGWTSDPDALLEKYCSVVHALDSDDSASVRRMGFWGLVVAMGTRDESVVRRATLNARFISWEKT